MRPFVIERAWDAGKPVAVAERGATLALLAEATVRRITAAATSPAGCPCCQRDRTLRSGHHAIENPATKPGEGPRLTSSAAGQG